MTKKKVIRFVEQIMIRYKHPIDQDYGKSISAIGPSTIKTNARLYTDGSDKTSSREELDSVKTPGFVQPQKVHEEGHFTQKAKKQLEELKKKAEKPAIDNSERKE